MISSEEEKEYLIKKIKEFKIWNDENKEYILNHLYIEKIKEYLLKEYGGEILSEPSIRNEYCSDWGDSEEYRSKFYVLVHFEQKGSRNQECVSFIIEYEYSIYKKDNGLWENFNVYRECDSVTLQGTLDNTKYPFEYRKEYNRAWQEGGMQRKYIEPKE